MKHFSQMRRFCTLFAVILLIGASLLATATGARADLAAAVTLEDPTKDVIRPGGVTNLKLTLSNNNIAAPISAVGFSSTLPGLLTDGLVLASNGTISCVDPAGGADPTSASALTAIAGSQAVSLAGAIIPAASGATDGICEITLPVTARSSDGTRQTYAYQIASGAITGNDGAAVSNTGAIEQSINVRRMQAPEITLHSFTNARVLILGGADQTLTFRVSNPNAFDIENFTFQNTFPDFGASGFAFGVADTPNATFSCSSGAAPSFSPVAGDTSILVTGTLPASGTCEWSVAISALTTNGFYRTIAPNFVDRASTFVGPGFSSGSGFTNDIGIRLESSSTRNAIMTSPLSMTVDFTNDELSSGQQDTMTIVLSNNAEAALVVSSFTNSPIDGIGDALYGLKLISGTPISTVCSAGGIPGSFAATAGDLGLTQTSATTIAANGTCTITVTFTGTVQFSGTPITYTNAISEGDVSVGDINGQTVVSQSSSDSILVGDAIRVSIISKPTSVAPGEPIQYVVTLENFGASAVNAVGLSDVLPAGMSFLTGSIAGFDYTPFLSGTGCAGLTDPNALSDTTVNFTLGTLPGRVDQNSTSSCEITYFALAPSAGGTVSNDIAAGGVTYTGGPNPVGSNAVETTSTPTLALLSNFGPSNESEGTPVRLRFTFSNWSAQSLSNLSFSKTLSIAAITGGQLRIAAIPALVTTCGGSPILSAAAGGTVVSMTGATVAGRATGGLGDAASCFVEVSVVGPAGLYNNQFDATAQAASFTGGAAIAVTATSNTATLNYASALSAVTFFDPTDIALGGNSTAYIRLLNSGGGQLSGLGLTNTLPAGLAVNTALAAYTTCGGATNVAVSGGGTTVDLTGAVLPAGQSCDLIIPVSSQTGGPWVNTIPVGGIFADGGVINVSDVSGTLGLLATSDMTISQAVAAPATLSFPGAPIELTIRISNSNTPVTGMRLERFFTDTGLDGGVLNTMQIAGFANASTTCTGGTVTATPGATGLVLSGASMAADEICEIKVQVTSDSTGALIDRIPAGQITTNEGVTNANPTSTSLTVQSDIGAIKAFDPLVIEAGGRSKLSISVINPSGSAVTALSVTDNLPAGMTVDAAPDVTNSCNGTLSAAAGASVITLTGGDIAAAGAGGTTARCEISVFVTVASDGTYENVIAPGDITGTSNSTAVDNADPAKADLIATDPIEVQIAIVGQTLDSTIQTGASFTTGTQSSTANTENLLTIRLRNPGSVDLTGVALTDVLPSGLVLSNTPNGATTCTGGSVVAAVSGQRIALTGASLAAGAACEITANVLSNAPGSYVDDIPVGDVTSAQGVTNALATSARLIIVEPPTIELLFDLPVIAPGGMSMAMVTLGNPNASDLTLTQDLVVDLPSSPGDILVSAPLTVTNSCTGTAETVVAGGATITLPAGAIIPAGGCALSVKVTGSVQGNYVGEIPAGDLMTDGGVNADGSTAPLAIGTDGYISGQVYLDQFLPADGIFTSGSDVALSGVTLELHSGADCTGTALQTTTTDSQGNYIFSPLSAGTYSVCQPSQPANSSNGDPVAGMIATNGASTGTPGTPSNPSSTSSQIIGIVLGADPGDASLISASSGNDFVERPSSRDLMGLVFIDRDDDGLLNGADFGLANIDVTLTGTDAGGSPVSAQTVQTDSTGAYAFTALSEGTYQVAQTGQPTSTSDGKTVAGSTGGTASVQGTAASTIAGIDLTGTNKASTGNNFPEVPDAAPDLVVSISHNPTQFASGSDQGTYTVKATNNGSVDSSGAHTIVTTLPTGIVPTAATGTGYSCTIASQVVTCVSSDVIAAGAMGAEITIATQVGTGLEGQTLTADAEVSGGGEIEIFTGNNTDDDAVDIVSTASISGSIWRDSDHDRVRDGSEAAVAGWTVEILLNGSVVGTATTDSNGQYSVTGLTPGTGYSVQFREPINGTIFGGAVPNETGTAHSNNMVDAANNPGGASTQTGQLTGITLNAGENLTEQSLPLDPAGVVYDAVTRAPISGAVVTITGPAGFNPATDLVGGSATSTTGADGFYQFLLTPTAPTGTYGLAVTTYPTGYLNQPSALIPGCTATLTVGGTPNPALVQSQTTAPGNAQTTHDPAACATSSAGLAAGGGSTQYYTSFVLDVATSADVLNNHIPLDSTVATGLTATKTTPNASVYKGALVPYSLSFANNLSSGLANVTLQDTMPPGFAYKAGTALLDGVAVEPVQVGRVLTWTGVTFNASQTRKVEMLLVVSAGVGQGEYVNQVVALNGTSGTALSNVATATVRIAPDPIFECSDIIGKVFDDKNGNGIQDTGEAGLSNVTVATVKGTLITTDRFGRYHVPCADIPDAFRGSNFIIKLDESTLPFGYKLTTENPEIARITQGRINKINFGAAIYRIARIELFEEAFNGLEAIPDLTSSLRQLPGRISDAPTIVQLVHMGRIPQAKPRLMALERYLAAAWSRDGCCYPLTVESLVESAPLSLKGGK